MASTSMLVGSKIRPSPAPACVQMVSKHGRIVAGSFAPEPRRSRSPAYPARDGSFAADDEPEQLRRQRTGRQRRQEVEPFQTLSGAWGQAPRTGPAAGGRAQAVAR